MLSNEPERHEYLTNQLDELLKAKRTAAATSFTLFQRGVALNALVRLKRAEGQLVMALHNLARDGAGRSHSFDGALALLPQILRSQRDRLRLAVDRQSIPALESWLESFTRDLSRAEVDVLSIVAKPQRSTISIAFDTYRLAPNKLADALKPLGLADVPF
jgi:hypothetical protein